MKWPLPDVIHPVGSICFQINVPNEIHYIGAFYGAMFLLTKPYAWGDDTAHTALQVAAVWRAIYNSLQPGSCSNPRSPFTDMEIEDEMPLRIDCDCNVFVTCCDGTEKQILTADQVRAIMDAQPGAGTPQPQPGGGCQLYHGVMGASAPWYVPTVVNTGDTIDVTTANGAWNDGDEVAWRCFDGGAFFAGSNTGVKVLIGTDPMPAVPHMALIALIDATYYDLSSGTLTIPGGHTNSQILLQPNDSPINDNAGTLNFDITVCNNQAGNWTSVLDFTTSPYNAFITPAFAPWTLGIGFEGAVNGSVPNWCQIDMVLDSCAIDSLVAEYHADSIGGGSQGVFFQVNGGGYGTPANPVAGGTQTYPVIDTATGVTAITVVVSTGTTGGPDKLTKLTITGHGPKPSQLP